MARYGIWAGAASCASTLARAGARHSPLLTRARPRTALYIRLQISVVGWDNVGAASSVRIFLQD